MSKYILKMALFSTLCFAVPLVALPADKPHAILTVDGTVFYPARYVADAFGANMEIDKATGKIIIHGSRNAIEFKVNQKKFKIGDEVQELLMPPFVRNGVTYLQARLLIEQLELHYAYDEIASTNALWADLNGHRVKITLLVIKDTPPPVVDRRPFIEFKHAREKIGKALTTPGYANPPWTPYENMNLQDINAGILLIEDAVRRIAVGVRDHNANRYITDLNLLEGVIEQRSSDMRLCDSERFNVINSLYLRGMGSLQDSVKQFARFNNYEQKEMYARGIKAFTEGVTSLMTIPRAIENAKNQYP